MKPRSLAIALLFSSLSLSFAPTARAQDDAVTVQARARFKEGVDAFDKGKFEEARLAFLQAYTLKKHPSVLLNLAQSSAKSNHYLEASKYFQQFLREATTANADQRKSAESGLAEVRTKLGRIAVDAPPGTDVTIDDQRAGTTPFEPVDVEIGTHTVKSSAGNATVIAVGGQRVEAKLGQKAEPPPPPPLEPTAKPPEPEKEHHHADLLSRPATMVPVYVGLGVAGAGVISAVVFGIFRGKAQDNANTVAGQIANAYEKQTLSIDTKGACNAGLSTLVNACKTLKDNNSKVSDDAAAANVSIGIAAAGAVFAGAWYLFAPKKDDQKPATGLAHPHVTPWATWNGGGLTLSGWL